MRGTLVWLACATLCLGLACGDDGGGAGGGEAGSGAAGSGGTGGTGGTGGMGGGGSGGSGGMECPMGYTGPDCMDCDAGYQDKDEDGTCTLACDAEGSVALNCGDHGVCDDSDGTRLCVCDREWAGSTCEECAEGYEPVRRSCDPVLPVQTGLLYWYDPDREITLNDDGEVTVMNNRAPGAFALVSAQGSRPTLRESAFGRRSALEFDAAGEKLVSVNNTGVLSSSSFTMFVVFHPSDTTIRTVLGAGSGDSWGMLLVSRTADLGATIRAPAGNTGGDSVLLDRRPDTTPFVVRVARLNNVLQVSAIDGGDLRGLEKSVLLNSAATNEDLALSLGAAQGSSFRGLVGELLVYEGTVSGADTTSVLEYLQEKWVAGQPQ